MRFYFFGAGGHAAEILEALQSRGVAFSAPRYVVDTEEQRAAAAARLGDARHVILAPDFMVQDFVGAATERRACILAIGDPGVKCRVAARWPEAPWTSVGHKGAHLSRRDVMPVGLYLAAFAYLGPNAILGAHVHVNRGAHVSHDCRVGSFVHVAPGAHLLGACEVGEGTEIGACAVVLPKVKVGANCRVGAGSVVTRDMPDGWVIRGNPARSIEHFVPVTP